MSVSGSHNLGQSLDWLQNIDTLKESVRLATSYNWNDVDLSQFQGKRARPTHLSQFLSLVLVMSYLFTVNNIISFLIQYDVWFNSEVFLYFPPFPLVHMLRVKFTQLSFIRKYNDIMRTCGDVQRTCADVT